MDLFRRDFAMNAMAMQLNQPKFGLLFDFFNGMEDIKQGRISVLHPVSFIDDPTRIMRAIRFQQRYDFKFSAQTEQLIRSSIKMGHLTKLTGSRFWHEIEKILHDLHPEKCIMCMEEHFGILSRTHEAFKTLQLQHLRIAIEIKKVYDALQLEEIVVWKLYFLVMINHFSDKELEEVLKTFLFPSGTITQLIQERKAIKKAIALAKPLLTEPSKNIGNLYFVFKDLTTEGVLFLFSWLEYETEQESLKRNQKIEIFDLEEQTSGEQTMEPKLTKTHDRVLREFMVQYLSHIRNTKADIDGNDLKKMGFQPSKKFAVVLKDVLLAKLEGKLPSKELQLEFARKALSEK
eukprot:TRINITY_DN390_c0_g1_i3.p1 TRINITY_DN390_c0_g1~~TRINITY_DN390_c0_g1_i3.p1  ORF type:complete len:347 (+),score=61.84 TRINITY_DN390_c0_g1_i3:1428-2468(+)